MTNQFYHDFHGCNRVPSRCHIMIFSDDGDHFICFENIGIGVSVTNASELLASQIVALFGYSPEDCRFFETYREYKNESFDEITYNWTYDTKKGVWEAKNANWKPGSIEVRNLFLE